MAAPSRLQALIDQYGPTVGPKLHHILQSRAGYKGVSTRRRRAISDLTGRPVRVRVRRPAPPPAAESLPLFPEPPAAIPAGSGEPVAV